MRAGLVSRGNAGGFSLRVWLTLGLLGQAAVLALEDPQPPAAAPLERAAQSADESMLFTPPGFTREGQVARVSGENSGRLEIHVRDAATGRLTACRLNVVGPDGNYYQPETNYLAPYGLTSEWPKAGAWGNRREKGPYRYLGRFFYTTGAVEVAVPPGQARLEAAKGFEFAPTAQTIEIAAGQAKAVEVLLTRTADAAQFGYFGGDPHFHFPRRTNSGPASRNSWTKPGSPPAAPRSTSVWPNRSE